MSGLRQLLRLDDKVAAEGRRLQNLGGPPMKWVAPTVLAVTAALHGAILLLPAVHVRPDLPESTPVPDLPLVWEFVPPVPSKPAPLPRTRAASDSRRAPAPEPSRTEATRPPRPIATEPVPEPAPDLGLNAISAEVEAIVPDPDTPAPSRELGPPSGAVPVAPRAAAPALVERVPPAFPVAARTLRAEGRVTLSLTVLPDGRVGGARVEECSRSGVGFETAALDAVKRWRYEPATADTGPRSVVVTIDFRRQEGRP
jgi:protein TonB